MADSRAACWESLYVFMAMNVVWRAKIEMYLDLPDYLGPETPKILRLTPLDRYDARLAS